MLRSRLRVAFSFLEDEMPLITVSPNNSVDLLHSIEEPWEVKGGAFYNDYATLILYIDGEPTEHSLILRRDGTWTMQAAVNL